MKRLIIDLDDLGIRQTLLSDGVACQLSSNEEGIAWQDAAGNLVFGDKASAARAHAPRDICDNYWDRLDTSTSTQGDFQRNLAELAAEHLQRVVGSNAEATEAIAIVPAHYGPDQRGILASIARDLQIPLRYIIPRPIACAESGNEPAYLHVDISLHSLQISRVNRGPELTFAYLTAKRDLGYLNFLNHWLKGIASEFVDSCRIDPLHSADGELRIRGIISQVLRELGSNSLSAVPVAIDSTEQKHKIEITEALMTGWAISRLSAVAKEITSLTQGTGGVLLGHNIGRIPGLYDLLSRELDVAVSSTDEGQAIAGVAGDWPPPAADDRCLYLSQRPRNAGGA